MRRHAKPIVVAESLAELHGPVAGLIKLPRNLDWTGSALYDLDEPARLVDCYRTVLIEATKPADLHQYLDQAILAASWPTLWLPAELREAWEQRFPELSPTNAGPVAA